MANGRLGKVRFLFSTAALLGVLPTHALVVPLVWNGPASGLFSDPSNWSPAVTPNNGLETYTVDIPNAIVEVDGTFIVDTFNIGATAQLNIPAGQSLQTVEDGSTNLKDILIEGSLDLLGDFSNTNNLSIENGGEVTVGNFFSGINKTYGNTGGTTSVLPGGNLFVEASTLTGGQVNGGGGGPATGGTLTLKQGTLSDVTIDDVLIKQVSNATLQNTITLNTYWDLDGSVVDVFPYPTIVTVDGNVTVQGTGGGFRATDGTNQFTGTGINPTLNLENILGARTATSTITLNNLAVEARNGGAIVGDNGGTVQGTGTPWLIDVGGAISSQQPGSLVHNSGVTTIQGSFVQAILGGQLILDGAVTLNGASMNTDASSPAIELGRDQLNLVGQVGNNADLLVRNGGFLPLEVNVYFPTELFAQDPGLSGILVIQKNAEFNPATPDATFRVGLNNTLEFSPAPSTTPPVGDFNLPTSFAPTGALKVDNGAWVKFHGPVDNDGQHNATNNSWITYKSVEGSGWITLDATSTADFEFTVPDTPIENGISGYGKLNFILGAGADPNTSADVTGLVNLAGNASVDTFFNTEFRDPNTSIPNLTIQNAKTTVHGGTFGPLVIGYNGILGLETDLTLPAPLIANGGIEGGPSPVPFILDVQGGFSGGDLPVPVTNAHLRIRAGQTTFNTGGGISAIDSILEIFSDSNPDVPVQTTWWGAVNSTTLLSEGTDLVGGDENELEVQLFEYDGTSRLLGTPAPGFPTNRPEFSAQRFAALPGSTLEVSDVDFFGAGGGIPNTIGAGSTLDLTRSDVTLGDSQFNTGVTVNLDDSKLIHDGSATLIGDHTFNSPSGNGEWIIRESFTALNTTGQVMETFVPTNPGDSLTHSGFTQLQGGNVGGASVWSTPSAICEQSGGTWAQFDRLDQWNQGGGSHSATNGAVWHNDTRNQTYNNWTLTGDGSGVETRMRGNLLNIINSTINNGPGDQILLGFGNATLNNTNVIGGKIWFVPTDSVFPAIPTDHQLFDSTIDVDVIEASGTGSVNADANSSVQSEELNFLEAFAFVMEKWGAKSGPGGATSITATSSAFQINNVDLSNTQALNINLDSSSATLGGLDAADIDGKTINYHGYGATQPGGDFNGDGYDDYSISGYGQASYGYRTNTYAGHVYFNTAPGSSPGTLTFDIDALFADPASTTEIEIAGLTPDTEHDVFNVTGDLALDGTLELMLIDGYMPDPYDTYTIISADSISGQFQTINAPSYEPGMTLAVSYTPTTVVVTAAKLGDLDLDGDIDGVDLGLFFANFTGPNNGPPNNPGADLDGDGDVDGVDLGQAFGVFTGPLAPNNIPEPTSIALLGLGGLMLASRRLVLLSRLLSRPFPCSPTKPATSRPSP